LKNKLIWVVDSPFSRAVKWLLLDKKIVHAEHILTWETMQADQLLGESNTKKQVPVLIYNNETLYDSLLIALEFLPNDWHKSIDAKLFRLGDSDFEAAIIFLFRAKLLETQFGKSDNSELLLQAGINTYKQSVDVLFNYLKNNAEQTTLYFGQVLAFSTILACRHIAKSAELDNYRLVELKQLSQHMNNNLSYKKLANQYSDNAHCELAFSIKNSDENPSGNIHELFEIH
jgi:hypothetical protein